MSENQSFFCLGEIVSSWEEFDDLYSQAEDDYDLIELWVDFIEDYSEEELKKRLENYSDKLVLLTRRNDGQDFSLSLDQRKSAIKLAVEAEVICDLDVRQQVPELELYDSIASGDSLIVSFHDYQATPDYEEFNNLLEAMIEYSPAIYKFATFSQSLADSLKLLSLYESAKDKINILVMAGGADGFITRVAAFYYKQPIIYAPRDLSKQVIPGQLSLGDFKKLAEITNGRK